LECQACAYLSYGRYDEQEVLARLRVKMMTHAAGEVSELIRVIKMEVMTSMW
jgi:hypothetical protein